jgi:hypothetical protein
MGIRTVVLLVRAFVDLSVALESLNREKCECSVFLSIRESEIRNSHNARQRGPFLLTCQGSILPKQGIKLSFLA